MEASKQPIITIGMIVKNEEKNLERTLRSFASLRERIPCEVIIADTGSQDGTREIACQYADEVFDYVWCDDFAAARNAVMSRAHGIWYWSIDADEPLVENIDHIIRFFSTDKFEHYDSGVYLLRNCTNINDTQEYTDQHARRLFRMATGLRFVHPMHEVVPSLPQERVYTFSELTAYHYGYRFESQEQVEKKRSRNVALIEQELARRPKDLKVLCEMMDIGYSEELDDYAQRTLAAMRDDTTHPMMRRAVQCLISFYYHKNMCDCALGIGSEFHAVYDGSVAAADIEYLLAACASASSKHEITCSHAERYFSIIADYDAGKYDGENKTAIMQEHHTPQKRAGMHVLKATALLRLNKNKQAMDELQQVELWRLADGMFDMSAACFAKLAREGGAQSFVAKYYEAVRQMRESEEQRLRRRAMAFSNTVYSIACAPSQRENKPVLEALAELPYQDSLLDFVRLVLHEQEPDFLHYLAQYIKAVQNWESEPAALYRLAMQHAIRLPEKAFEIPLERVELLTSQIMEYEDYVVNAVAFLEIEKDRQLSATELLFLYVLLARALIMLEKVRDKQKKEELISSFVLIADMYLDLLYRPEVFAENQLAVLPALHRFGHWLRLEQQAKPQDRAEYLKKAIEAMPSQKPTVDFLTMQLEASITDEAIQEKTRSDEFMALAQNVKQEVHRLISQGMVAQARSVAQQLSQLCPEDEEVKQIVLMLSHQLDGIH